MHGDAAWHLAGVGEPVEGGGSGQVKDLQSDQSTRAKSAGNDYSRNILKIFILVTSVVSNYPKECPLTKIFDEDAILGDKNFF